MTAPEIQPGTRCECRSTDTHHGHHFLNPNNLSEGTCCSSAVRLVTVRHRIDTYDGHKNMGRIPTSTRTEDRQVLMCTPCFEYHEAKAAAR